MSTLQPRRVLARASKHAMLQWRPCTYIIDQSNSISNLKQFISVVRNYSKKNGKAISSRARLNVEANTVQLVSHIQMKIHLIQI